MTLFNLVNDHFDHLEKTLQRINEAEHMQMHDALLHVIDPHSQRHEPDDVYHERLRRLSCDYDGHPGDVAHDVVPGAVKLPDAIREQIAQAERRIADARKVRDEAVARARTHFGINSFIDALLQ